MHHMMKRRGKHQHLTSNDKTDSCLRTIIACFFLININTSMNTNMSCSAKMGMSIRRHFGQGGVSAFTPSLSPSISNRNTHLSRFNSYISLRSPSTSLQSSSSSSTISTTPVPKTESYHQKQAQLLSSTPLSLAPMMEYTDRHFRHMVRLVSSQTLLYTEMVTANAIVHERREAIERNKCNVAKRGVSPPIPNSLLESQVQEDIQQFGYDMTYLRRFFGQGSIAKEGPSVLQLGGSDPLQLSEACDTLLQLTERNYCDYTAVNLNCGCPSPKVAGKGCFGAALMDEPELVRDCVIGMHNGCQGKMPITVKCRIGTDQSDMFADTSFTKTNYQNIDEGKEYSNLCKFIETVASSGVVTDFQIHARIAVLSKNFSPADNRKVPQLKYQYVRKLVDDYPEFTFSLNGGLNSIVDAKRELEMCENLKGVMIGRGWAANPWSFSMADDILYDGQSSHENKPKNRLEILEEYGKHADAEELLWDPVKIRRFIVKAATPLFAGEPNGKKYRIALDSIAGMPKKLLQQGKSLEGQLPLSELLMNAAMENIREDVLLRSPEETYERMYGNAKDTVHYGGAKVAQAGVTNSGSTTASSQSQSQSQQVIRDWQNERKEAEAVRDCQQIE